MSCPLPQGLQHHFVLADGSRWVIAAGDEAAAASVSRLADAMRLRAASPDAVELPLHAGGRRLLVFADAHHSGKDAATRRAQVPRRDAGYAGFAVCILRSFAHGDGLFIQLVELSSFLARDAQTRGGVLLHGALAEKDGNGVILAAPGGRGKTTASDRLPAPWRSLCDDTTLVVRDAQGDYWAHPWPTWSRFLNGGPGGAWDVRDAVPLKGVFFLSRAFEDRVESVGRGQAVSLLVESAEQNSQLMMRTLSKEETRALHLERFNNLCALVRVVPTHVLHLSLTGAFWQQLERMLPGSHRNRT